MTDHFKAMHPEPATMVTPVSQSTQPDSAKLNRLRRRIRRTWRVVSVFGIAVIGMLMGSAAAVLVHAPSSAGSLTLLAIDSSSAAAQREAGEEVTAADVDFEAQLQPADHEERIVFDGRPLQLLGEIEMTVTAYSPDERSCGPWNDGFTASGYSVWTNGMRLVAADTRLLPFGTVLTVDGYNEGSPVQVLDRGGAIKGKRLDVLFATHEAAREWGVKKIRVKVWGYSDQASAALPSALELIRTGG